ncbi:PREDICTED: ras-related protein Rab-39A-like [Galeopterus variegatus]|uniref:Ras-related protein Rab-39A-like n=1 Tax=Galeopterus variegatus TaxID=482537 RepID=A0ABM0QEX4_GALVR|nr:PREDICTED: ras-related protein Rab-39A-like [Galeopterus variegatus]
MLVTQIVEVNFSVLLVEVEPGVQVKLQFWGESEALIILILVVSHKSELVAVRQVKLEEEEKLAACSGESEALIILILVVSHKSELVAVRQVKLEEEEKLAASLGTLYVETSAKSNSNIGRACEMLTQETYDAVKITIMGSNTEWKGVKNRVPSWAKLQEAEDQSRARWICLCW